MGFVAIVDNTTELSLAAMLNVCQSFHEKTSPLLVVVGCWFGVVVVAVVVVAVATDVVVIIVKVDLVSHLSGH